MTEALYSSESTTKDNFFTGAGVVDTREISVKVGQNLAVREVVALETTSGLYVTYVGGGANGIGVAVGIMPYAVDATAAETKAQMYSEGTFNPDLLVFSGAATDLHKANMFINSPISLQTPQL